MDESTDEQIHRGQKNTTYTKIEIIHTLNRYLKNYQVTFKRKLFYSQSYSFFAVIFSLKLASFVLLPLRLLNSK